MIRNSSSHSSFNRWLIVFGIIIFGFYIAYDSGLISQLLNTDKSYLSSVIIIIFFIASLHIGWRANYLGEETQIAIDMRDKTMSENPLFSINEHNEILVDGTSSKTSFTHTHLGFMAEKARHRSDMQSQELLLDHLENRIHRGHESGWFIADLMIRLGLLGTVVGFILMLGSMSTVENVDIHTVQQLLTNMSDGMRTALYTTFAGLSAGILLSFQYQLLDQAADHLLTEIIEISEVHAARHLRKCALLLNEQ